MLRAIAERELGSTAELAAAIEASPAMVEAMVAELERRGLLQRAGECGTVCSGCPAETLCGTHSHGGAWILTTAGRRYAES